MVLAGVEEGPMDMEAETVDEGGAAAAAPIAAREKCKSQTKTKIIERHTELRQNTQIVPDELELEDAAAEAPRGMLFRGSTIMVPLLRDTIFSKLVSIARSRDSHKQ